MQQNRAPINFPVFSDMHKGSGVVEEIQQPNTPFWSCFGILCPCFDWNRKLPIQEGESSLISASSQHVPPELFTSTTPPNTEPTMRTGTAILFSMDELNKATSNFSSSCKIGEGGFGSVYRGRLRDRTIVAIKRARKDIFETSLTEQFQSEVNMLANIEHLNLVRLIGYVEKGDERILVEEFVANHNLREHLDCKFGVVLDFFQRIDIAIDVAHALTYLHLYADKPIIHRDVKSSNILLTETFRAKVADFGFSRTGPTELNVTHVVTQVKGTAGYLDPEYLKTYKLTTKSDVYAFGILLVELFSGRRPIEQSRVLDERITVRWAYSMFLNSNVMEILDPHLKSSDAVKEVVQRIFELAFRCSAPTRHDRPTMKEATEILWLIRKDYQRLQKVHDNSN